MLSRHSRMADRDPHREEGVDSWLQVAKLQTLESNEMGVLPGLL